MANPSHSPKMIRALAKALADEAAHLRKLAMAVRVVSIVGGGLLFLSLYLALGHGSASVLALVFASFLSGLLFAMSAHFKSSAAQWPLLSRFLDRRAVQDAVDSGQN